MKGFYIILAFLGSIYFAQAQRGFVIFVGLSGGYTEDGYAARSIIIITMVGTAISKLVFLHRSPWTRKL